MRSYIKYWQNVVAILIVSGLLSFPRPAAAAGSVVYEQAPGHFGGFSSDGPTIVVADEFQLGQSTLVTNITWWGGYASPYLPIPSTDDFTIQLYDDNGGKPGVLLQSFDIGNNAARTATGNWVNPPDLNHEDPDDNFQGRPEFQYSFDLPAAFLAVANTRYWLSIINVPSSDSWAWEVSASPLYFGVQRSWYFRPWEPYFDNTAFRLHASEGTPPLQVNIDILPGVFPNAINIEGTGTVPVAILSNPAFNAPSQVNKPSLTFGRTQFEHSYSSCSTTPVDVNGDGLLDLVCRFKIQWAGFQLGDTVGILTGKVAGTNTIFVGTDSVSPFLPPEVFP